MLGDWNGAPPVEVAPQLFILLTIAPAVAAFVATSRAIVQPFALMSRPINMLLQWWSIPRWLRRPAAPTTSTMALPKLVSMLTVSTWNCASLNLPDRVAALHDRATSLGRSDIVFLQEMRLAAPASLPKSNPFLRLHHPYSIEAHQAVLGPDTGILIRNTRWIVEEATHYEHATYARVRIPETEPAVGDATRLLHLWSVHAPANTNDCRDFWNADVPELSRLDASCSNASTAAIVGADWNAVFAPMLDNYPPNRCSPQVPHGLLAQAGLVDVYRTLHPTSTTFTRYHRANGELLSARCIDAIAISTSMMPHIHSVETQPTTSDHSAVSVRLKSSAARRELGPGVWRLHREAHLQPGFILRMGEYAAQLSHNLNQPPIRRWYDFVERIRATSANLSATMSQKLQKKTAKRLQLLQELNTLDIRHGDGT